MKRIYIISAFAALLWACTPAEDIRVTTTGPEPTVISCSGDVVLSRDYNSGLALTVNWNDNNNIGTTGVGAAPKNATINYLQFSATESFENYVEQQTATGSTSAQLTVEALNTITAKLGMAGNVKAPLYIRLASTLATNVGATYSNVVSINVTPYTVDLSKGHVLDKNHEDTGQVLKVVSDKVYAGFVGVTSWFNWFLLEGSGSEWGNLGQEGQVFHISTAADKWNMWFPEPGGCYYATVDTGKAEWSALYIGALTLSGGLTGEMTYDRATNTWNYTYEAASAGSVSVSISGTGWLYDVSTGDGAYNEQAVGFGGSASAVTFGQSASPISVDIPSAGEVTLTLNLTDMTLSAGDGGFTPTVTPKYLYIVGVNDGWTNAAWDFDNYLILYDESTLAYAGACNINSKWGYRYYTEKDSWTGFYTYAEGDALSGKLVADVDSNVPAPETGLYVMKVSLKSLEYTNIPFTSVQIAGVAKDSDWELLDMEASTTAGVYSLAIDVDAATPWGFKIYVNGSWDDSFGGSDGELIYGADGCPVPDEYIGSTCLFTVDLCKGTYSIEKQ